MMFSSLTLVSLVLLLKLIVRGHQKGRDWRYEEHPRGETHVSLRVFMFLRSKPKHWNIVGHALSGQYCSLGKSVRNPNLCDRCSRKTGADGPSGVLT